MKRLDHILTDISLLQSHGGLDLLIENIHFDSRKVEIGDLFIAVRGTATDGHNYIAKAIKKGAVAVLCEELPEKLIPGITYGLVENTAHALVIVAHNYYERPSEKIKLVGVTGTNGITTVATLLYQLFEGLGYHTG